MVGNVACYVHILHADLTLGLEVDLGGQLNPDWSACSGPAGGCKARLPGLYVIPGYRLTYEWVSTRPSSSTCYFGAAKAGQSSRRRFRPYECSSSAVSGPFSRSTSCTRSLGPKSWSCAKFRTSSVGVFVFLFFDDICFVPFSLSLCLGFVCFCFCELWRSHFLQLVCESPDLRYLLTLAHSYAMLFC